MKVAIIDYGAGNTMSVKLALQRIGVEAVLSDDADVLLAADKVIFPGVGHARHAMEQLRERGLDTLIPSLTQPVLGICLGMQLMCAHSEEGDTPGLGIFDERVTLFPPAMKVPHMGWNTAISVSEQQSDNVSAEGWYYFVHSYYVPVNRFTTLTCDYIQSFSAAMRRDNFYAAQFHPEKSGEAGQLLLEQFLQL